MGRVPSVVVGMGELAREVDADPFDIGRVHAALAQHSRYGMREYVDVVLRMLQRPIRRQFAARGQLTVHHAVRVIKDGLGHFGAVARVDQYRPPGQSAEVKTPSYT